MIKKSKMFNYAVGMFGTSIPINMFKTYAAIYYVDKLGVSTAELSLVLFLYTFVDVIDNPIYGWLSDRTRTKWGRRRPWLLIGTPLLVLCFILFYSAPATTGTPLFVYLLLMYILTGTLDSLINSNYGALFPDLFPDEGSRATTNALRQAFQLFAMVISIALTPMVTDAIGYRMTALVYGILGGIVIFYMTLSCREDADRQQLEKPKLLDSVVSLIRNKHFWIAGFTNAFYTAAMSLLLASLPFFAKYTINISGAQQTILFAVVLFVAAAGVSVWTKLIKKFTLMRAWRVALIVLGCAFALLNFSPDLWTTVACLFVLGFGFAGVISTMDLIGAKIMDEDTARTGLRREGIISSTMGVMNRLSGLYVALGFLLVLRLYGFESGDNVGDNPAAAARFLFALFPLLAVIVSAIFSFMLNFDKGSRSEDKLAAASGKRS